MKKKNYNEIGRFVRKDEIPPFRKRINTKGIKSNWVQILDIPSIVAGSNALVSLFSYYNTATPHMIMFAIATSYNSHSYNLLSNAFQESYLKAITKIRLEKETKSSRMWKVFVFISIETDYLDVTLSHQMGIDIPSSTITDVNPNAFFIKEYDL